ncbi:NAD-dependent epimerase/dehydratase family protein [Streptomyces sp. NPDC001380]|uniref:NAD-dependent epimerase/dehydratase family protein n=1 Tax=Streptomyces sp. NPDC001380 TaxID=3364566 RepID=UPI0036C8D155
MRVLLLGADGFIGRRVADRLLADPELQVTVLGRRDTADIRFDLSAGSPGALARFLDAVMPRVIINCAGATYGSPRALTRANTVAVATVCEAVRRSHEPARLIHVGSAAEYGPAPFGQPVPETAEPRPLGPYGVTKLAGTELVLSSGLDAAVLRVFDAVGPGAPTGSLFGRLAEGLRRALERGEPQLRAPDLSAFRDFVDVRDVARAVQSAAVSAATGIVNIGSGTGTRVRDAAELLVRASGFDGRLVEEGRPALPPPPAPADGSSVPGGAASAPPGPGAAEPRYPAEPVLWRQADVRTARDRLGWRPRIPLEESLADVWTEIACRV